MQPSVPTASPVSDAELELAFAVERNPGAYALLIGAGVSAEAGMPTAWEVQMALIAEIAATEGAHPRDPAAWWSARTGTEPQYDDLLERVGATPAERQAVLRGFFEATAEERARGEKTPSDAHRAIARLVAAGRVRILVTLNFDHLLETALRDAGVTPTVASTPAEFAALLPLHAQRALVVHLHGDWANPGSLRNTASELSGYDEATAALVANVARDYGLISVGWSATWDTALCELLAANPNPSFTSWYVNRSAPTAAAERLWTLRRARPVRDTARGALGRLADGVDAIAATHARHPRSAAVAVASAKRALQGEGRAIALHDELRAEFDRLTRGAAATHRPDAAGLAALEEAARVLLALVTTTAYWGDASTDLWWRGEIGRLAEPDASGTDLRAAPAAMLLWAGGAAALAAGREEAARELLSDLTLRSAQDGFVCAAEALSLDRALPFAGAGRWLMSVLRAPLAEHVGLGERGWEEAWERFTYLQLLERVLNRLDDAVIERLKPVARDAWLAHPWGPSSVVPQIPAAELVLRRSLRDRSLPALPAPHLRGGGYFGRRYPAVSAPLRRELNLLEVAHPLLRAGFAYGDLDVMRVAVSATDLIIEAAARARTRPATGSRSEWLDD